MKIKGYHPFLFILGIFAPLIILGFVMIKLDVILSFISFIILWGIGIFLFSYLSIVSAELKVNDDYVEFIWIRRPFMVYQNLYSIKLKEIKKIICSDNSRAIHFKIKYKNGIFWIIGFSGKNYYEVYDQLKLKGVNGVTEKEQIDNFKKQFRKKRKN